MIKTYLNTSAPGWRNYHVQPTEFIQSVTAKAGFALLNILIIALIFLTTSGLAQADGKAVHNCAAFNALVKATYNFDEAKLSNQQKLVLEKKLDSFWKTTRAHRAEYLPCLRKALQNPDANPFFRFDGSNLLVELDPSIASKTLQVQIYTGADWDLVGAERWMDTMLMRGIEGINISAAAERWMCDPEVGYVLPEHGDFEVDSFIGALFLFGSMNEAQATPALLKIVQQKRHPQREAALELLTAQATPEAWHALQKLDMSGIANESQANVKALLKKPQLIVPRSKPLVSRAEFLKVFQDLVKGNGKPFFALVDRVGDGERDAVVVLRPEDWPLVRQVRRRFMAGGNQHSIEYAKDFTHILWTLVWKQEPSTRKVAPR